MEGDGLAVLLEVAGSGQDPAARVRRWSVVLLGISALTGLLGAWYLFTNTPRPLTAVMIEDGFRPTVPQSWWARRSDYPYEITGRLLDDEAVVRPWPGGRKKICAPLVSDRPGAADHPRVYFEAWEADYYKARAENRFVGNLEHGLDIFIQVEFGNAGRPVGPDTYVLIRSKWQRLSQDAPRSMLTVAFAVALLGLIGLVIATRMQRADDT